MIQRLLLFNLVTDADDSILGFTTSWINALAARCGHVDVITMRAGRLDVAANVRVLSVGAERGWSEPRRALEFYRLLLRVLRERPDACFSHMMPLFSAMGGPLLRARGIPLVTWYAHPKAHGVLRAAHLISNRMVTSLPSAYPGKHDKLEVIGQGIDMRLFAPVGAPADPPIVLCAGRLSPVKDHPTLLRAAALVRDRGAAPFRVVIRGRAPERDGPDYVDGLHALVHELRLEAMVAFEPDLPREALVAEYGRCTVHVNLTPAGFGDKVAWEAMACARPCLVANHEFRETLGPWTDELLFAPGDAVGLADRLAALLALPADAQQAIGDGLRSRVAQLHSLDALAGKILRLCEQLRGVVPHGAGT